MKKQIAIVSTILVVALIGVFAFAACTPSLESLQEKYKEEGYLAGSLPVQGIIDSMLEGAEDVEVDEATVEYAFMATKLVDTIIVVSITDKDVRSDIIDSLKEAEVAYKTKGNAIAVERRTSVRLFVCEKQRKNGDFKQNA